MQTNVVARYPVLGGANRNLENGPRRLRGRLGSPRVLLAPVVPLRDLVHGGYACGWEKGTVGRKTPSLGFSCAGPP